MIDAKQLGRRIRQLREERGLTQEKLAYECGWSKSYLSEIEAGKKLPSLSALGEFADRLGVPAFDLLIDPSAGIREQLMETTRGMPEASIAALVAAARKTNP